MPNVPDALPSCPSAHTRMTCLPQQSSRSSRPQSRVASARQPVLLWGQVVVPETAAARKAQIRLAHYSLLFRPAAWGALAGLEQDVLRVNLMTVSRRGAALLVHVPRSVKAGISSCGRVAWTVELILFGLWLFGTGEGYRPISVVADGRTYERSLVSSQQHSWVCGGGRTEVICLTRPAEQS